MLKFKPLLLSLTIYLQPFFSFAQTSAGALDFDGVDDYVQGFNDSLPQGSSAFTIEGWIYPTSFQNGTIFNWGIHPNRVGLMCQNFRLYFIGGGGVPGSIDIPPDTWTHVAAAYDGTEVQLYVNGMPSGGSFLPLATSGKFFRLGCSMTPVRSDFFKGKIDEIRIWRKALTACEIKYSMHKRFAYLPQDLISYFGFNQGEVNAINTADSLLDDRTDNSRNAKLYSFNLSGTSSNWVDNNPLIDSVYTSPRALIVQNPDSSGACINKNFSFVAYANIQSTTLNYQWTKNAVNIPGATASTFVTNTLNNRDIICCIISTNNPCLPSTLVSNEITVNVLQSVYKFTGNGSWDVSSNWANENIPPSVVPSCISIVIDPVSGGECLLDEDLLLLKGSSLSVMQGKSFRVTGDLQIFDSAALNALTVFADTSDVATGAVLSEGNSDAPNIEDMPEYQNTQFRVALLGNQPTNPVELPMPTPGHQGQVKSCTSWAVVYGAMSYIYKRFERNDDYDKPDKKMSPAFLFYQINLGANKGVPIEKCIQYMMGKGSPRDVDLSGSWPPYFFTDPHPLNVQYAPLYKAYNFVQHKDDAFYARIRDFNIEKVKGFLSDGSVIVFAAYVDRNFKTGWNAFYLRNDKKIYFKHDGNRNPDNLHAMVICGYDDVIKAFKVMNSWGSDRANGGFYWINYDVLKSMMAVSSKGYECFVMLPKFPDVTVSSERNTICSNTPSIKTTITVAPRIDVFERGICYWHEKNPTTGIHLSGYSHTVPAGSGAGTFDVAPDYLLTAGYYIRAYAKTSKGIVYGNEIRVEPPKVTIAAGGNGSGTAPNKLQAARYLGMDQANNLYVLEVDRVTKWAPGAPSGVTVAGGNGFGNAANQWGYSNSMFVDPTGNIYIADQTNHCIQKWAPGATSGITVAGIRGEGWTSIYDFTRLYSPKAVTVDNQGNIYIVEQHPRSSIQGGIVIKWAPGASTGIVVAGGNGDGNANNQLINPSALCVDGFGALYIADHKIMKWIPGATSGLPVAVNTGTTGMTLDKNGNIYYSDYSNNRVMRWTPGASSGIVVAGSCPNWGIGLLDNPRSVVLDSEQNIYVDKNSTYSVLKWPKY